MQRLYNVSVTVCLILLSACLCYSIEPNDSVGNNHKKIQISVFGGVLHAFRNNASETQSLILTEAPGESYNKFVYNSANETGKFGYKFGVAFELHAFKNIFFRTGLHFTSISTETKSNTTFYLTFYGNMLPTLIYDTTSDVFIKHKYSFVSVPVCLNYRLIRNKFYYSFGVGFSGDLLYNFKTITKLYGNERNYDARFQTRFLPALVANIGINWSIVKNIELGIEPEFKYYLSHEPQSNAGYNSYQNFNLFTCGINFFLKF